MTPRGHRRQRTEDRRPQIADAALRILATRGAAQLTAAALGREVGIADSTVFRHYRDMDEVVLAAIERVTTSLAGTYPDPQLPGLARLRAFFMARLGLVRDRPAILRLATSDRLEQVAGVDGARRLREAVERSKQFIEACLRDAQAKGDISSDLDVTVLGWAVRGALQGAVAAVTGGRTSSPSPEATWTVVEELLRGYRTRDRRAHTREES